MEKKEQDKDFVEFKQEFERYQTLFGLLGYRIFFQHEPFADDFAGIKIDLADMTATVRLNSKLPKWEEQDKDIVRTAKHEACHLLLGRIYELAKDRWASGSELYEAMEEVAHKLERLIP